MHRLYALAILFAIPTIATAQVYKCQGPDGATTYSGSPCSDDAAKLDIREDYEQRPEHAESRRERTREWLERREQVEEDRQARRRAEIRALNQRREVPGVSECPSGDAIKRAVRRHDVMQCMTRAEVRDAEPIARTRKTRYNKLLESGISVEVWRYTWRDSEWPRIIYFRGDYVAGTEEFL